MQIRALFWTRNHFAQREIMAALSSLPIDLKLAETLPQVLAAIGEADMFLSADCNAAKAAQLAPALAASSVRWFQFLSAGRERLLAAGLPPHLELFGIGDSLAPAMGEHGMALALALYRGVPQTLATAGDWAAARAVPRRGMDGDTGLVVGLGPVGRDLARRARLFGMDVLAATRTPAPDANCSEVRPLNELGELLPRAGLVFLSIALAPETHHIIGREAIARMRRGAFLVNLARGGLIDQAALLEALRSGALGGAGLDVTDPEPLPPDDPLWSAPNLIVSPHVSVAGSLKSAERIAAHVARNVEAVAAGFSRRS